MFSRFLLQREPNFLSWLYGLLCICLSYTAVRGCALNPGPFPLHSFCWATAPDSEDSIPINRLATRNSHFSSASELYTQIFISSLHTLSLDCPTATMNITYPQWRSSYPCFPSTCELSCLSSSVSGTSIHWASRTENKTFSISPFPSSVAPMLSPCTLLPPTKSQSVLFFLLMCLLFLFFFRKILFLSF